MSFCCCLPSSSSSRRFSESTRHISSTLSSESEISRRVPQPLKLLLLGSGNSGKSTLFKQAKHLFGTDFTPIERKGYVTIIAQSVISAMKILIKQLLFPLIPHCHLPKSLELSSLFIQNTQDTAPLTREICGHLKSLWSDRSIRRIFQCRSMFQFHDNNSYFLDHLDRLCDVHYLPTVEDIMRCRVRTTGVVETEISIDSLPLKLLDAGGQKSERKKWINCFDGVTAILFVSAISEFDQTLEEDGETNRLQESLNLFEEIVNTKVISHVPIILMMNKVDIFAAKLSQNVSQESGNGNGNGNGNALERMTQNDNENNNMNSNINNDRKESNAIGHVDSNGISIVITDSSVSPTSSISSSSSSSSSSSGSVNIPSSSSHSPSLSPSSPTSSPSPSSLTLPTDLPTAPPTADSSKAFLQCFPHYRGPVDIPSCLEFIENEFRQRCPPPRPLYVNVTCSIDSNNMKFVLRAVTKIVQEKSLKETGLL